MNYFSPESVSHIFKSHFAFIKVKFENYQLHLTLNRPEKKNALHPHMLQELAFCLQYAHITKSVRVVIISAAGDTFCAGMDLKALAGHVEPYESDIASSGQEILIGKMMQEVYKPLIADVRGSVYAGGFLILAGCHYVISKSSLQFALPEVKRGLFPMQVMASLSEVIPPRKVLDWCIRGYSIDVHKALDWGLITHIADYDQDTFVQQLADSITSNSPTAIRLGLEAYDHLHPSADLHNYLHDMFQQTIQSPDGQEGLAAFREKRPPKWEE